MRFIRGKLVAILVVASIVIFGEMALGKAIAKNQELIQPPLIEITEAFKDIPYNPDMARDREDRDRGDLEKEITRDRRIILRNHRSESNLKKHINEFAWRDFVALNWPSDCQGKPLDKLIGQAPEAPRVWELYPSPKDVFLPNGATPLPLDKLTEDKKCVGDGMGSEIEYKPYLRLTETGELAKKEEFREAEIASRTDLLDSDGELKSELVIDRQSVKLSVDQINKAIKIPLVDRQGNYVINEIRINPVEYNQIRNNKWYDANKLVELIKANKQFNLACSERVQNDSEKYCAKSYDAEGAIEIKAVWRVFDERNPAEEKAKYYTTTRTIDIPDENFYGIDKNIQKQFELGLIGFHIMHKTSQQGWIWSTFEHIDNAPPCDDKNNEKARPYILDNKKNWPYVRPPYLWRNSNKEPKAITLEGEDSVHVQNQIPSWKSEDSVHVQNQIPSQICRTFGIPKLATEKNEKWQEDLNKIDKLSVWQYYQLIDTQWLSSPRIPYSNVGSYKREIKLKIPLTNTALEPYAQGVSCIVCHTAAHLPGQGNVCQLMVKEGEADKIKACADFSFLFNNYRLSKQPSAQQN